VGKPLPVISLTALPPFFIFLFPISIFTFSSPYDFLLIRVTVYDGINFPAKANAILVTVSYRLGVLGYLADGKNFFGPSFPLSLLSDI